MRSAFKHIADDLEDALNNVVRSLRRTAESLSGDASDAVSKTAADITRASEVARKYTTATAKRAAHEAQEHPLAVAAIITAAAALVALTIAARRED